MRLSITFLSFTIILALLLTRGEGGVARRGRRGRGGHIRRKGTVTTTWQRRRNEGQERRKGRQEQDQEEEENLRTNEEGTELHNGCDHTTNIGAFLNFLRFRKFCGEKGVTDFGPYGGVSAEGSGEGQNDGVVVVEVA